MPESDAGAAETALTLLGSVGELGDSDLSRLYDYPTGDGAWLRANFITSVDGASNAADKRLSAGEVIVEVAQEAVSNAADVKKRIDQLKKDGKKSILLLVSNADGELRFVALSVQ